MMRRTGAFVALLGCSAILPLFSFAGVLFVTEAAQAQPVLVAVTRTGRLGSGEAGVMSVDENPTRAGIMLARDQPVETETLLTVLEGQQVIAGGQVFAVSIRSGPDGWVAFKPVGPAVVGGAALPDDAVALNETDGRLRVNGPDLEKATDAQVTAMQFPPEGVPSATIEAWPANRLPHLASTAPLIRRVVVHAGDVIVLGTNPAKVLAIEAAARVHPARVLMRPMLAR